jgi:hypothetical protein
MTKHRGLGGFATNYDWIPNQVGDDGGVEAASGGDKGNYLLGAAPVPTASAAGATYFPTSFIKSATPMSDFIT